MCDVSMHVFYNMHWRFAHTFFLQTQLITEGNKQFYYTFTIQHYFKNTNNYKYLNAWAWLEIPMHALSSRPNTKLVHNCVKRLWSRIFKSITGTTEKQKEMKTKQMKKPPKRFLLFPPLWHLACMYVAHQHLLRPHSPLTWSRRWQVIANEPK